MAKPEDLSQPVRNCSVELVKFAHKKMVYALNNHKMILAG